jgi:putative NADH-flavin reductase
MNVTIFGATGNVGRLLVEYALADGHSVTAFVHNHHNFTEGSSLQIIKGDAASPDDVAAAITNSDAVISALSSWGTKDKNTLSSAMKAIIPVLQDTPTRRIISLTGADARVDSDASGMTHKISHFILGVVAGKVLRDGEQHIQLLQESGLDWTVIRSPIMTNSPSEVYSLSDQRPLPWQTVSRRAVARAMINELASSHSQQAPFIR